MADPHSITASVVGIIVPALHGTRLLLEDLQQLKDAPKTVKRLVEHVHSVDTALKLLQGIENREWDLLACTQACDLFRTDLQRWTRYSNDGKLVWQDRVIVGFFKYSSVRHSHITEEIRQTISTKQVEVKGAITTADKQLAILEKNIEELNLSSDDEKAVGSREGKTEALRQLEEEFKGVKASQKLLNELLSKSQEEAVAKAAVENKSSPTTVTFGSQNLGFQVGLINGDVNGISFRGK